MLGIIAESWKMIVGTLKGLFSQMIASFPFPERWTNKIVESGDLNDQMKCTRHSKLSFSHFWCAMLKNKTIEQYFFENENVTESTYKGILRHFFISQTSRLPINRDIPTWWCTFAVRQRSNTIFGYESPRSMDEERRSDFLAFTISRFNPVR